MLFRNELSSLAEVSLYWGDATVHETFSEAWSLRGQQSSEQLLTMASYSPMVTYWHVQRCCVMSAMFRSCNTRMLIGEVKICRCEHHVDVWRKSAGTASYRLNRSTELMCVVSLTFRPLCPWERPSGVYWIGGWMVAHRRSGGFGEEINMSPTSAT